MVELGDKEGSVSVGPQGENNYIMLSDNVTLTSHETLNNEYKREWRQVMKEELGSLMKSELVPHPKNCKIVN